MFNMRHELLKGIWNNVIYMYKAKSALNKTVQNAFEQNFKSEYTAENDFKQRSSP